MNDCSRLSRLKPELRIFLAGLISLYSLNGFTCTVDVTGASFGAFDPLEDVAVDTTGTIMVTCSPSESYTIELSAGASGTFSPREMDGPGDRTLSYNLYLDSPRTIVWGDGSGSTSTVDGSDGGSGNSHTVYGRIPAGQNPYVGSYADSIVVTVVF